MRAVVLRVRSGMRRGWPSAVAVAAIVAVIAGTVLALAAGARRTSSAPDAFTAAVGGDPDGYVVQPGGTPRTAEVAALPGVRSLDAMTFVFAGVVDPVSGPTEDAIGFAGTRPSTARLVAGRDATDDHEFVVDQKFARRYDAQLGDHFRVVSFTQEQADRGEFFDIPAAAGPSLEVELVGIIEGADVLETEYSIAVFSPALLEGDVGTATTNMIVHLDPGVTLEQLRAELDALPGGSEIALERGGVVSAEVRNAIGAQAQGIWVMAVVAGLAAVVAVGQLLTRHVRLPAAERERLEALGYTKGQLVGESLARAAVPLIAGVAVGAGLAVAASGVFPAGFVRTLEPEPGVRLDPRTLGVVAGVLTVGVLCWVAAAMIAAGRRQRGRTSVLPAAAIADRAPTPAAATGTRFAFAGPGGPRAVGTLLALALLVGGVVGATAFGASLDRLVTDRSQFGSNFDVTAGDNSGLGADELRTAYEDDPDVAALIILTEAEVRAGESTVGLIGVEHVRGDLTPRHLAGRLPQGPDEVALGRVTARQLGVDVGDDIELTGSGGTGTYRIVGIAVVPTMAGNDGVGQGGVVTSAGLYRLEPVPTTTMAALRLDPGAPADARDRLMALVGEQGGFQDVPSAILNIARVRRVPGLLAVVLAVLTLLTMVHGLLVSVQRRRRDLAVLSALGADRSFVARTVHWQATALTVVPIALGVPLGLIAGSFVFRAFADRLGAVPDPAIPILVVLVTVVGLLGVANVAAVVPARRARHLSTALQLRTE